MPYNIKTIMNDALLPLTQLQLSTEASLTTPNSIHGQAEVISTITKKFTYFVHDVEKIQFTNRRIMRSICDLTAVLIKNATESLKALKRNGNVTGLNTDLNTEIQQTKITALNFSQQHPGVAVAPWKAFLNLLNWLQTEIIKNLNSIKRTYAGLTQAFRAETQKFKKGETGLESDVVPKVGK